MPRIGQGVAGGVPQHVGVTVVRSIMNWFATRHDDYQPPIIKGMRRQNPKEQVRERILADDEIREVWKAAEANGTFGAFVRVALLTAQRRATSCTLQPNKSGLDMTSSGSVQRAGHAADREYGGEVGWAASRSRSKADSGPS